MWEVTGAEEEASHRLDAYWPNTAGMSIASDDAHRSSWFFDLEYRAVLMHLAEYTEWRVISRVKSLERTLMYRLMLTESFSFWGTKTVKT